MSQVPQVTSEKIRKALFIRPGVRLPSGSKAESLVLILEPYDQANILLSMQARLHSTHPIISVPITHRFSRQTSHSCSARSFDGRSGSFRRISLTFHFITFPITST